MSDLNNRDDGTSLPDRAKNYLREYPPLIEDTPIGTRNYETLRNVSEAYSKKNDEEPSEDVKKNYLGILSEIEKGLIIPGSHKTDLQCDTCNNFAIDHCRLGINIETARNRDSDWCGWWNT